MPAGKARAMAGGGVWWIDNSYHQFILLSMKVGERGQITIPKELRERFGIRPSSEVEVVEKEGRLVILKKGPKHSPILKYRGMLRHLGKNTDEIMEELRPWRQP